MRNNIIQIVVMITLLVMVSKRCIELKKISSKHKLLSKIFNSYEVCWVYIEILIIMVVLLIFQIFHTNVTYFNILIIFSIIYISTYELIVNEIGGFMVRKELERLNKINSLNNKKKI